MTTFVSSKVGIVFAAGRQAGRQAGSNICRFWCTKNHLTSKKQRMIRG